MDIQLSTQVHQLFRRGLLGQTIEHRAVVCLAHLFRRNITQQLIIVFTVHIGLYLNKDIACPILLQQQSVFGCDTGNGRTHSALSSLTICPGPQHRVDIYCAARSGERTDFSKAGDIVFKKRGAVKGEDGAKLPINIDRALQCALIFLI